MNVLDVRALAPRLRQARILEALQGLAPGATLALVSDHDPRPLHYQLQAERPGTFAWRYVEEGPAVWRVEIRKSAAPIAGPAAPTLPGLPRPPALAAVPEARRVELDVREPIRRGEDPFGHIMGAVKALGPDQVLVLRAPFEPVPLYGVLATRGFAHWAERRAADDWLVWFYREPAPPAAGPAAPPGGTAGNATIRLDVRGLEPPQPMVQVLGRLEALGPEQTLEVLHDRRPLFLYPQLDDRGFVHETDEPAPGVVRIVIRRGGR